MLPRTAFSSPEEYLAYLRDWFAGQALAGLMANASRNSPKPAAYAMDCYLAADAMLAAREASNA